MAKQQPKSKKELETISILLPTRGRQEVLKNSLVSLVEKASHPERLEILFGVDQDDEGVVEFIKNEMTALLNENKVEARASIFKPLAGTRS